MYVYMYVIYVCIFKEVQCLNKSAKFELPSCLTVVITRDYDVRDPKFLDGS